MEALEKGNWHQAFAVSVYVRNRGAVLLVKHRGLGCWLPIGGELLPDERPESGARRKLKQETGIHVAAFTGEFGAHAAIPGAPKGFMGYEEHPAGANRWHMAFAFRMDVETRVVVPCEQHEEHAWLTDAYAGAATRMEMPPNVRHLLAVALVIK